MNKEQDYASDTDESDEDFQPDKLAGESAASEDEEAEDSEANGELSGDNEVAKEKPVKRKKVTKKQKTKKKSKTNDLDESEDDGDDDCAATTTSRRATRQTDDGQNNGKGKSLEKDELESDDEDKSRTSALWADFLKDVKPTASCSKSSTTKVEEKPSSSSSNEKSPKANSPARNETSALEILKPKVEDKKIVVTEVVDFAGEEVRIEREVDASSIKENKAATIPPTKKQPFGRIMPGAGIKRTIPSTGSGSSGGLGSLLNQLGKKKKISVLEKSQMDWNSFKQSEGIDEQLQTFNKGKDGYLERQDFLQRTDLRQFEIEKNLRQTTRRPF